MTRLTTLSKLLITVVIVVGLYFIARKFIPALGSGDSSTTPTEQTNSDVTDNKIEPQTEPSPTTPTPVKPFNFTPTAPVNGKLKGVVELGATGFNSFIIRMDNQKNWQLEKAEYGASLVYEKLATDDDIKKGLKNYIADMLAFGVASRDIHFVISSGAKKVDVTAKITAELKKMGYVVNEVTPQQEAKLALKSVLPREYENRAFVMDIGSGNTKISYVKGGQVSGIEASGSKYYQNNMTDDAVYKEVSAKCKTIPTSSRETCFIIGGVPFELAKQIRNGKERYTVLKAPGDYTVQGEKQKAGLNIYKAAADATGCQQFVFDWDANFTIGFLLSL